ncbi:MAG TPA: hypothetical protein VJB14_03815 [Planctomycetota bacterium]|nr:hypothetical protein [Planctomycetota bacterium]
MTPLAALLAFALAQDVTDENYEKLKTSILPPAEELAWRKIPWRPTFWEAVVEAQEKEKPILLWAMNGHPLACT